MSEMRPAKAGMCVRTIHKKFAEDKGGDRQEKIRKTRHFSEWIRQRHRLETSRKRFEKRIGLRRNSQRRRNRTSRRPQEQNKKSSC